MGGTIAVGQLFVCGHLGKYGLDHALLEHEADVNTQDETGRTALIYDADLCYTWDVRALLDGGADPTIRDKRGRTALETQLVSVEDPKCAKTHGMIEDAGRSRAARNWL